jgi:hypothetical protein
MEFGARGKWEGKREAQDPATVSPSRLRCEKEKGKRGKMEKKQTA